jgi:hypothetical protein
MDFILKYFLVEPNPIDPPSQKMDMIFSSIVQRQKKYITACESCGIDETYNKMVLTRWRLYKKDDMKFHSHISFISNCVKLCISCYKIKKDNPSFILVEKEKMTFDNWILLERQLSDLGNLMTNSEYHYILNNSYYKNIKKK